MTNLPGDDIDLKADLNEAELQARHNEIIDHDRDTFLPRPSNDPKDPLNWPMSLKVSRRKSVNKFTPRL